MPTLKVAQQRKELKMSRSIKSLKKLRSMVGQKVKVCTLDNVVGICLVTEDDVGDICLISKDKKLLPTKYFWDINDTDIERLKNYTADYVTGHFCCYEHQLTGELKWVTSSVSRKKTVKETDEDILEPKSVKELWDKVPCRVRLCDGQVGFAETEESRQNHATVYFNNKCDTEIGLRGWSTDYKGYKYGWYVNGVSDFETIFGKKYEKPAVEDKLEQSEEPSQQDILKEILETLKEIKNEIAKR